MVTQLDKKSHLWTVFVLQWLCYTSYKSVTAMQKKVRLVFNRRKIASETASAVVEIVVCLGRERFYESTGVFITINQWEDGIIINHPQAALLNDQIQKKVTEFQKILIAMEVNHDDMTPAQFKTYLTTAGGNRRNYLAWMRERIQERKLREGTRKGHITTFKALQRFGKIKTFDDITLPHIHEFDLFLKEEKAKTAKGKPISRSQAAIHNYHKRFKSYVNEAFRLGLLKENPYDRFQDKRGEKGERPHLTKSQIKRLIAMRDASVDPVTNKYLDFFLFQIFTGMAYTDAKSFDYQQHVVTINKHSYIDGHRMKTGEEFVTPILPYTQKILERNNYHLTITSNQKYNQFLKGIGVALGCSFPLTTHIARHTFACTISLGEGIPKEVLQVMMGHSSIKTTELYAKMPIEFVTNNVQQRLFNVWK